MDKIAIIVAAGSGTRMGSALPKQFLPLAGKPVILHTLEAFIEAFPQIKIILVLPEHQLAHGRTLVQDKQYKEQVVFTPGGNSRFESVARGLALVDTESLVAVHDGVRCLVTPALIRRAFESAAINGSAIPVLPVADSLRKIASLEDNPSSYSIDRDTIRAVQTPQAFQVNLLKKAYAKPFQNSFTDEASVVEAMGEQVHLIEGEPENIKITRPLDLFIAEAVIRQRLL